MIAKYVYAPNYILVVSLVALEIMVYCIYPVENMNRKVDESEDRYFKARLGKFLIFDSIIGMVCVVAGRSDYLLQIVVIFFAVVITMLVGKYMNNQENSFL
ncbi:MAG: accessory gene regulator B family protein [Ruminococcus flavefaciens]|nr:accessory gene regulator B family protein [Ruminococcus flavefaciens]